MFADDIKIYRAFYSISDSLLLQQDLDKFSEWTQKWLLKFSLPKCVVLPQTTNYTMTEASDVATSMCSSNIPSYIVVYYFSTLLNMLL